MREIEGVGERMGDENGGRGSFECDEDFLLTFCESDRFDIDEFRDAKEEGRDFGKEELRGDERCDRLMMEINLSVVEYDVFEFCLYFCVVVLRELWSVSSVFFLLLMFRERERFDVRGGGEMRRDFVIDEGEVSVKVGVGKREKTGGRRVDEGGRWWIGRLGKGERVG
ncbi:hypothetical protein Tco_0893158 [Tanacetum coccineum]|uniref:Uncharacterized protein n=1 Tax=Tanacetum coccineum TaxID=301880 RepID=A0ABQ5CB82_9ASTR